MSVKYSASQLIISTLLLILLSQAFHMWYTRQPISLWIFAPGILNSFSLALKLSLADPVQICI
jgi:hypothetical protein